MTSTSELVLGIDGGGTKTVAWLGRISESEADPKIIGRGTSGPSNVRAIGLESATANLDSAIDAAFTDARIKRCPATSACFGLAGAGREAERTAIEQWATQNTVANRIQVVHDALPVLYAASKEGVGIALISGTGSLAFGRDSTDATARCGGWGHLFGDEGSGYAIAIAGLKAAARFADGRGPKTVLLEQFLNHLGLSQPQELVSKIYSPEYDRTKIASLSKVVFRAADEGDSAASEIINQAVNDLAELVSAAFSKLTFADSPIQLALTGGVLANRPDFRELLLNFLNHDTLNFEALVVTDPVAGSVQLALESLGD